jgi:hypothetical protein
MLCYAWVWKAVVSPTKVVDMGLVSRVTIRRPNRPEFPVVNKGIPTCLVRRHIIGFTGLELSETLC